MTDLPPTDALKGLLARATRGPWTAFDWEPPESDGQQVFGRHIGSMRDATTVAKVLGTTSGLLDGFAAPIRQADANARLIALAPSLAARVIELEAEVANLRDAIHAATDPDFIWGAMDNVFDMDSDLDDLAAAASRAIRAALGDRT